MTSPIISVLMPVYNGEDYLSEAIESILKQTQNNFEFLIANDGSTDSSLQIIKKYAKEDNRIRIISRENKGLINTLNELKDCASGIFLARMDADDIAAPERFAKQVEFLESNPEHVAVGSFIERINHRGMPIGVLEVPTKHSDIDKEQLKGHCSIWHPTAMIRAKALIKVKGYDLDYETAEDFDLWLRLSEIGKLANLPYPLLKYRIHNNSVSGQNQEKQMATAIKACKAAWLRRGISGTIEVGTGWRPAEGKSSQVEYALKYGWISWQSHHKQTACYYALQALKLKPFNSNSWSLLFHGLFKPHKI